MTVYTNTQRPVSPTQAKPRRLTPIEPKNTKRAAEAMIKKLTRKRRHDKYEHKMLIIDHEAHRKLLYFRNSKDTEVGAMAITKEDDPLWVVDFEFIEQECTSTFTEFDDDAQSDWFHDHMQAGHSPENFLRVWAHTHPGDSATPSNTDWTTFDDVLGQCPWKVMLILGMSDEFCCIFQTGEQAINIPVAIAPRDVPEAWGEELKNITKKVYNTNTSYGSGYGYTGYPSGRGVTPMSQQINQQHTFGGMIESSITVEADDFEQLTSKVLTVGNVLNWTPTYEDIYTYGLYSTISLFRDLMRFSSNTAMVQAASKAITKVFDVFGVDDKYYFQFDTEDHVTRSPLCALWEINKAYSKLKKARDKCPHYAAIHQFKKADKVQAAFIYDGRESEIADHLCSTDQDKTLAAMLDVLCCVHHYPKYGRQIDEAMAEFYQGFLDEQNDYEIQIKEVEHAE